MNTFVAGELLLAVIHPSLLLHYPEYGASALYSGWSSRGFQIVVARRGTCLLMEVCFDSPG